MRVVKTLAKTKLSSLAIHKLEQLANKVGVEEKELFEKRKVETGIRYKGWIEIKDGLEAGEHVVTKGGYMVKLASTSTDIGHPHVH